MMDRFYAVNVVFRTVLHRRIVLRLTYYGSPVWNNFVVSTCRPVCDVHAFGH